MLFIRRPQTAADIRAFCTQFNENIRVEYKSTFDENVRRRLPSIVASFANSLGGILIIGVEAVNGVPRDVLGFVPPPNEELPLTVENICLQNINPPILPKITTIPAEDGRIFLLIEVDESWEAPHALENSKRVYVRTGNAGNPYDLADVNLIIELVRRRAEPLSKRELQLAVGRKRASTVIPNEALHVEISISPVYPRHPLCSLGDVWAFLTEEIDRGARFFPVATLRRVDDGVASFDRQEQYSQVNIFGLLFAKRVMRLREFEGTRVVLVGELFHPLLRLLKCAKRFYQRVAYRGPLEIGVVLRNTQNQMMPFLADPYHFREPTDYQCMQEQVTATHQSSSELLIADVNEHLQVLLGQLCWSFWQAPEDFPAGALRDYTAETLRRM